MALNSVIPMKSAVKKLIKILAVVLVALVFVTLSFLVTNKKDTEEKEDILPSVRVQKPEIRDLVESITISGYVEAKAMIPVVPFVSGTITEYPAKAGDFVKKDTLLAKIDDEPFRQQMLQAQAAYFAAKSTFDRVESLYKSAATSQQNYDNARAQYDASKAQYDLAKLQMGYTEVRAPVEGTIRLLEALEHRQLRLLFLQICLIRLCALRLPKNILIFLQWKGLTWQ